jgi:hypothetical protein
MAPTYDLKDLLQIDVTAIAGILILVTISAALDSEREGDRLYFAYIPFIMAVPFALSGFFACGGNYSHHSQFLTQLGFMFIIIYLGLIAGFTLIDVLKNENKEPIKTNLNQKDLSIITKTI